MFNSVKKFNRAAIPAALFVLAIILAGVLLSVGEYFAPADQQTKYAPSGLAEEELAIVPREGGAAKKFKVEISETEKEKAVGLMFRTELADDRGMIFHYGTPKIITMWMRNTYIPLDMLFIDAQGEIIRIEEDAEPQSERVISSERPAAAVLEIPGGAVRRLGISVGDRVEHRFFASSNG